MANFNKHLKVGATVGTIAGVVYFIIKYFNEKEKNPDAKFDWEKFILTTLSGCAFGAIAGISADLIEPATNPNHRGFFHSYAFWMLLGIFLIKIVSKDKKINVLDILSLVSFAGYSSHLFLDMQTPKSLPLLGIDLLK